MPRIIKRLTLALIALCCLAPAAARAETIVINGGSYVVHSLTGFNQAVGLTDGSNFVLSAAGDSNLPPCMMPASGCVTGAPMSPAFNSAALNFAALTYNGVTYSTSGGTSIGNVFGFTGPSFTPVPGDPSTWEVPFNFSGGVFFHLPTGEPVTLTLTGSGIARFEFTFSEFGFVQARSATYTFQPQATPEPATLILFGGGAAALGAKIRRGRRRRAS